MGRGEESIEFDSALQQIAKQSESHSIAYIIETNSFPKYILPLTNKGLDNSFNVPLFWSMYLLPNENFPALLGV